MATRRTATLALILAALSLVLWALPASAHQTTRHRIHHAVSVVYNQKGDPYVYGATGPNAFDCSGLTLYGYRLAGVYLPRTSDAQYRYVRHIRANHLRRGDFVFYHDGGGHVFHVAMFAGRRYGQSWVLEAEHTGTVVGRHRIWDAPRYAGTLRHKP